MKPNAFYISGGTLPLDAPSYIRREADDALYTHLAQGEYCYVLTARQMGKSSLMVRTADRLRRAGFRVVLLDLTAIGRNLTAAQWYYGLLSQVGLQLNLEDALENVWLKHSAFGPIQRFMKALSEVALPADASPLIVFLDEIDCTLNLPFSTDEFFAAIRECYNRRSYAPEMERLTFCLLGVATPADLIRDTRTTPFNISRRIELNDFTPEEAAHLAQGFALPNPPSGGLGNLARILYWTNGHPYLTQRLCQAIVEENACENRHAKTERSDVDRLCESLFLSAGARNADENLLFVRERLLHSDGDRAALLDLYAKIEKGRKVEDNEANPLTGLLRLSGITRTEEGCLRVRNRIYAHIFDHRWIEDNMPDAEVKRRKAAYRLGLFRASALSAVIITVAIWNVLAWRWRVEAKRANNEALNEKKAKQELQANAIQLNTALKMEKQAEVRANQETNKALIAKNKADAAKTQAQEAEQRAIRNQNEANAHRKEVARLLAQRQIEEDVRKLDSGDSSGLLDLLDAYRVTSDLPEIQESAACLWSAWYAECTHRQQHVLVHDGPIRAIAYSPDGKLLATTSDDCTTRLWDTTTGQLFGKPLHNDSPVKFLAFSPDGRDLATVTAKENLSVWSVSGGTLRLPAMQMPGVVMAIAFRPKGNVLAIGLNENQEHNCGLLFLDPVSGQQSHEMIPSCQELHFLRFTPDGNNLVIASRTPGICVRNMADGQYDTTSFRLDYEALCLAVSSDSNFVAAGTQSGDCRVWNLKPHHQIQSFVESTGQVEQVDFIPKGGKLLVGIADGRVSEWNLSDGQRNFHPIPHVGTLNAVRASPTDNFMAVAAGNVVKIWDLDDGITRIATLPQAYKVTGLEYHPNGKQAATICGNAVLLWNVQRETREIPLPHSRGSHVYSGIFSPDSRRVVTTANDAMARLWQVSTGKPLVTLQHIQRDTDIFRAAFSADGKRLATFDNACVYLWDAETGNKIREESLTWSIHAISFRPDGKILATLSDTNHNDTLIAFFDGVTSKPTGYAFTIKGIGDQNAQLSWAPEGNRMLAVTQTTATVWDRTTHQTFTLPLASHATIRCSALSPNGKYAAFAFRDNSTELWNIDTRIQLSSPQKHENEIYCLAFRPDSRILATGASDGVVSLWDVLSGKQIGLPIYDAEQVYALAFSPDGKILATATRSKTARFWDVATCQPLGLPLSHLEELNSVAYSPDGQWIVTTATSRLGPVGSAHLWRAPLPPTSSPEEMNVKTQQALAARHNERGWLEPLSQREWERLQERAIRNPLTAK
ncbi:MAG TPA: AAA-like domain-containing protein [Chthonomonadaceae bacterium]|nr:AAA-like domain-containing protein [Chthonomonadaceae bacterium]